MTHDNILTVFQHVLLNFVLDFDIHREKVKRNWKKKRNKKWKIIVNSALEVDWKKMSTFVDVNIVKYLCSCGKRHPICRLYLCRHCLKLRCGDCVQHEVILNYGCKFIPDVWTRSLGWLIDFHISHMFLHQQVDYIVDGATLRIIKAYSCQV